MNPSVLAQQLQQAVSDFLRLSFETTTPFFDGLLERFLTTPGLWLKCLTFQSNFPLRRVLAMPIFSTNVPLSFPPHKHLEMAFKRIGVEFKSRCL
jgi:DEAD/DEAH box helicase domain-containing protein